MIHISRFNVKDRKPPDQLKKKIQKKKTGCSNDTHRWHAYRNSILVRINFLADDSAVNDSATRIITIHQVDCKI